MSSLVSVMVALVVASGGVWSTPQQMPLDTRANGGNYSATFDSAGRVYVATADSAFAGAGLFYMTQSSDHRVVSRHSWEFESAIAVHHSSSHTVVRIVWVDTTRRDALWLTRNDTGSWVTSRLWLGRAHDPVATNLGQGLGVAFRNGTDLWYLSWDPVTGPSIAEHVTSQCCTNLSAIATHNGAPAIAFSADAGDGGLLHYATRSGGTWSTGVVANRSTTHPSLAFGTGNATLIAYGVPGVGVFYAHRTTGGWHRHQVLNASYTEPSIASDSTGEIGVVATGGMSEWIAFERLDVASSPVILDSSSFSDITLSDAHLGLAHGQGSVVYHLGCGCPGDGEWTTHQ